MPKPSGRFDPEAHTFDEFALATLKQTGNVEIIFISTDAGFEESRTLKRSTAERLLQALGDLLGSSTPRSSDDG